jgi:outer membrane protein, multidrug efflux system
MKIIPLLLSLCAAAWLEAGCSVGPNYHPPPVTAPTQFTGGANPAFSTNEPMAAWWQGFGDVELVRLTDRAIACNLDLRIATANLLQARALRLGAKADFLPVAEAGAGYSNVVYSEPELFNFSGTPRRQVLYDAGFDATWELDIFGRLRRAYQASTASMEAAAAERRDVQVSLVSEVARNYFELRGDQNELSVLRGNADNQRETLKITLARLDAGRGTELDVARARAQLNNTLAEIPPMEAAVAHATHRLGVLTGQQPEALIDELRTPQPIPALPSFVAIGNPGQLLRRRPDIRAAERNLAAATAGIGVAVADLFPRVTFNGAIGLEAESFSGLGKPGSDMRSFGPAITWAALDYGHVRARIKAAGAVADAQIAQYEKTVLTSLEETENALVDFGRERARREFLAESVKASQAAAELAHIQYDNGATDFLTVLDAERVLLESQDQLAQTETQTAIALVAVYKSLDGGWDQPSTGK